jgi:predicted RNA-binding Zn ribbon-like protein
VNEPIAISLANAELASAGDLATWLRASGWNTRDAGELALRLPDFGDLRSSLRELLAAAAEGRPLPDDAVEGLNETSARVPRIARLEGGVLTRAPVAGGPAPLALARIAWSAMELLGGPDRERVRRCGACGRFFMASRPDRVWCSDRCGNRTRVARHHARVRGPAYPVRG